MHGAATAAAAAAATDSKKSETWAKHLCDHSERSADEVDGHMTTTNSLYGKNQNLEAGPCSFEIPSSSKTSRWQRKVGLNKQVARALGVIMLSSVLWAGLMHWGVRSKEGLSGEGGDQTTIGPTESIDSSSPSFLHFPPPPDQSNNNNNNNNNLPSSLENSAPSTGPRSSPLLVSTKSPSRFSTNRSHASKSAPTDISNNRSKRDYCKACINNSQNINPFPPIQPRQTQRTPPLLAHPSTLQNDFAQDQEDMMMTPEPIVYQYTIYYPGNIPLVITAGHGGSCVPGKPANLSMTHNFTRVPNLDTISTPLTVADFSTPVYRKNDAGPELFPQMPPRDRSQGGRFLKDLNTHSMAVNIAKAVACLVNVPENASPDILPPVNSNSILKRCIEQVPWTGEFSDEEFFPTPIPSSNDPSAHQSRFTPPSTAARDPSITPQRKRQSGSPLYIPHVVVFQVRREYVDVNRNLWDGNTVAEGNHEAEAAWREYHDVIDHVQKLVMQQGSDRQECLDRCPQQQQQQHPPQGLLLDIHGHAHSTNLIEIGYLWDESVLRLDAKEVDEEAPRLARQSSIRSLVLRETSTQMSVAPGDSTAMSLLSMQSSPSSPLPTSYMQPSMDVDATFNMTKSMTLSTLLWGKNESLGGMFGSQGLESVPSPEHLRPCDQCAFYSGGYTIQRHGSGETRGKSLSMDAIQLEFPATLRQVDKVQARKISLKIGRVVVNFMGRYYKDIFPGAFTNPTGNLDLITQFLDEGKDSPQTNSNHMPTRLPRARTPHSQELPLDEPVPQQISVEPYDSSEDSDYDSHGLKEDSSDINDGAEVKENKNLGCRPEISRNTSRL